MKLTASENRPAVDPHATARADPWYELVENVVRNAHDSGPFTTTDILHDLVSKPERWTAEMMARVDAILAAQGYVQKETAIYLLGGSVQRMAWRKPACMTEPTEAAPTPSITGSIFDP